MAKKRKAIKKNKGIKKIKKEKNEEIKKFGLENIIESYLNQRNAPVLEQVTQPRENERNPQTENIDYRNLDLQRSDLQRNENLNVNLNYNPFTRNLYSTQTNENLERKYEGFYPSISTFQNSNPTIFTNTPREIFFSEKNQSSEIYQSEFKFKNESNNNYTNVKKQKFLE